MAKKEEEEKKEEKKSEPEVFQEWVQFSEATGIRDPSSEIDANSERVQGYLCRDMIAAWKEKNDSRPSDSTIAPDVLTDLNIHDTEGNGVYRVVAMRKFSDDVVKAFRRNGITAKPFDYDYQKW